MKILYVDYFQKDGHVNFNRIHIDALRRAGHDVKLVMHREIAQQLPYEDSDYALQLPRLLRFRQGRPLVNRIVFLVTLLYIKLRVRVKKYDKVILGCIDEISYNILPLRRDVYIHAHGNGRFLPLADGTPAASPTKFNAMKRLAPHAHFIVYNDYMARPFRDAGFTHVDIVSHGCVPPFEPAPDGVLAQLPFALKPEMKVVFHPSGKCNEDFIRRAVSDEALHEYLASNDVHIILRNRPSWLAEENVPAGIHFINGFLSTELYQALFFRADLILMCYPPSFHHQVSGVSFECVANAKLTIALYTPALEYIRSYYNYEPLFADVPALVDTLSRIFDPATDARIIVTPESLQPDYSSVLQ